MLLITDKYKNFSDFKRYVIEPAIKDINEHSTMKVSYETDGTRGKKVSEITFTCVDNFILPNADEKVKKAKNNAIKYFIYIPQFCKLKPLVHGRHKGVRQVLRKCRVDVFSP